MHRFQKQFSEFTSPVRRKAMGAADGGDSLQGARKPDLDSEAFAEVLHEIQPALRAALQSIQHRGKTGRRAEKVSGTV